MQGRQFLSPRCVVGSKAECYSPGHTAEIWGKEMGRRLPLILLWRYASSSVTSSSGRPAFVKSPHSRHITNDSGVKQGEPMILLRSLQKHR